MLAATKRIETARAAALVAMHVELPAHQDGPSADVIPLNLATSSGDNSPSREDTVDEEPAA
jgi:hypothetical protein